MHRVVRWSLDWTGLFVDCPKVFWRTNVDAAVRKPKARALRKLDKRFKLSSTMVVNPLRSCEDNKNILDSSLQYCSSSWNGWCLDFVNCNSEYRWSLMRTKRQTDCCEWAALLRWSGCQFSVVRGWQLSLPINIRVPDSLESRERKETNTIRKRTVKNHHCWLISHLQLAVLPNWLHFQTV